MSKLALMYACGECFGQIANRKQEVELRSYAGTGRHSVSHEERKKHKDDGMEDMRSYNGDQSVHGINTHHDEDHGISSIHMPNIRLGASEGSFVASIRDHIHVCQGLITGSNGHLIACCGPTQIRTSQPTWRERFAWTRLAGTIL